MATAIDAASGALVFDGVNDFVLFGDSTALDVTGHIAVEVWVFPTDLGGDRFIVARSNPFNNNGYLLLLRNGYCRFQIYNGSGVQEAPAGADAGILLQTGRWYHVAGSYDGAIIRVFVNGRLSAATACGAQSIAASGQPLRVGANTVDPITYFAGTIDEVRVSSIERYTSGFAVPSAAFAADSDTHLLLHFDEASGDTVTDSSVNAAVGRLGNAGVDVADPTRTQVACSGDRGARLGCDELYGFAPGYVFCAERPTECEFYLYGGGTVSCTTVCVQRGVTCPAAYGNTTAGGCGRNPEITCDTLFTDEICLCVR